MSDAEWNAYDRARAIEDAAFDELLTRAPATGAGMRAALAHFISFDDGRFSEKMRRFLATLAKGCQRFLRGCDLLFELDALQFQGLDLRLPGAKDAFLFRTFSR